MKRLFAWAAALAVTLVSCVPSEKFPGSLEPIRFGPCPVEVQTKTVREITSLTSFNVVALHSSDASVLFSDVATGGSEGYTTEVDHFFPDGFIDIVASNHAVTLPDDGSGPCIDYVQDKTCDIVAATSLGLNGDNNPVSLTFIHILSQLELLLVGKDTDCSYDVRQIRVIATTGGRYDIEAGEWTHMEAKGPVDIAVGDVSLGEVPVGVEEGPIALMPSQVRVRVVWTCTKDGILCGTYDRDCLVDLTKGCKTTATLTLPNDNFMTLTASVTDWQAQESGQEVLEGVRPESLIPVGFDVNDAGKRVRFSDWTEDACPWDHLQTIRETSGYDWEMLSSSEWSYLWMNSAMKSISLSTRTYSYATVAFSPAVVLVPREWKLKNRGVMPPNSYTAQSWEQYQKEGFVALPIKWTYWTEDGMGVKFTVEDGMTFVSYSESQRSQSICRGRYVYQI